jgi:hypothetical protein
LPWPCTQKEKNKISKHTSLFYDFQFS